MIVITVLFMKLISGALLLALMQDLILVAHKSMICEGTIPLTYYHTQLIPTEHLFAVESL